MKKNEISALNVLFCLMVIFIHVTSAPITNLPPDTVTVKILFSIHRMCGVAVYGFVFLSGVKLFLKDTSKIEYSEYIIARLQKIYIPYLIVTVLYYLYEIIRGFYVFDLKQLAYFLVTGSGECHLYFVILIMQFYLLFPLWKKAVNFKNTALLLITGALINVVCLCKLPDFISHNHTVFTSYIFIWFLGCVCGKYYDEFTVFEKKNVIKFGVLSVVLLASDVYMSYSSNYYGIYFNSLIFNVVRMSALSAFIMFLMGLFTRFDIKILHAKLFNMINNASFEIYLVHLFVLYAVSDFINKYFSFGQLEMYLMGLILVYVLSITLCVIYKYVLVRIKK